MSATNNGETDILSCIFKSGGNAWSADANFYLSLHTADPGETGDQTTSEASYTSYARVAVSRTSGFSVSANVAFNPATVAFPAATGGSSTITHFGIGTSASGAGRLLFSGALTGSLAVTNGITPQFGVDQLRITCD
jgi:hypothetical protein